MLLLLIIDDIKSCEDRNDEAWELFDGDDKYGKPCGFFSWTKRQWILLINFQILNSYLGLNYSIILTV